VGGKRALLIVVGTLLTEAAVALTAVTVLVAVTSPAATPESPPLGKGLSSLIGADPTAGTLTPDAYDAVTAEVNARAALRTDGDPSANRYSRGLAASAVGQVLGPTHSCTATVVESRSERVAVTAAHCVYWPAANTYYNPPEAVHLSNGWTHLDTFLPGRSGDHLPFGKWSIQDAWIDPIWRQTGDPRYDVAFLRLGTHGGVTPQRALGAESVVFDSRTGRPATVLGYPTVAPFDGTHLRRCATPATAPNPRLRTIELRCRLNAGSSGGPWLTDFDADTGRGTVMAVTGYGFLDHDVSGGERLGAMAQRLYTEADTNAPHR
jgi:V8-like Glu-specific endopeptidase